MVLALVPAARAEERQAAEVDPGAVFGLQPLPDLFAFVRRKAGALVHGGLELVDQGAVGDEVQRGLKLVAVELLGVFPEEQGVPGAGEQLHRHGVRLRGVHGRGAQLLQRDAAEREVACERVARLVGQDLHVAGRAVEVGEDERRAVVRKVRAVSAAGLALFAVEVEQLVLKHKVEELARDGVHLAVHPPGLRDQLPAAALRRGVAVREQAGVVVQLQLRKAEPLCLPRLDSGDERDEIARDLPAELCDILRAVAVAPQPVVAERDEVFVPELFGLPGAVPDQLAVDFVQALRAAEEEPGSFFPGLPARGAVGGNLVFLELREVHGLAAHLDPGRGEQLFVFRDERVFPLFEVGHGGGKGAQGDFDVLKEQAPRFPLQLPAEPGGRDRPVKALDVLFKDRRRRVEERRFLFVERVDRVDAVPDVGEGRKGLKTGRKRLVLLNQLVLPGRRGACGELPGDFVIPADEGVQVRAAVFHF